MDKETFDGIIGIASLFHSDVARLMALLIIAGAIVAWRAVPHVTSAWAADRRSKRFFELRQEEMRAGIKHTKRRREDERLV